MFLTMKAFFYLGTLSNHCVKSVHIRKCSGPHFPAFGLSNSEYGDFSRNE